MLCRMSLRTSPDIVPRPELRASLLSRLQRGSVLLYGARRIGKSTLLQGLADGHPDGWLFVRVDLEGFLDQPLDALPGQLARHLRTAGILTAPSEIAEKVESVGLAGANVGLRGPTRQPWWARLEDNLQAAVAKLDGRTLVVALDEVPWWLDAVERDDAGGARAALGALRRIRQHDALVDHVRWVLTGSIGLAGLASALGASAELNDLDTQILEPMPAEIGAALFELELATANKPCVPTVAQYAAALAGGSPYWIRRLAFTARGGTSTEDIDSAAELLLAPTLRKQFADEGREHFKRRHPEQMPALLAILEALSGDDSGLPTQAALNAARAALPDSSAAEARECLYLLIDGFYLREAPDGTLGWVMPLFRRWWLRYGGAG